MSARAIGEAVHLWLVREVDRGVSGFAQQGLNRAAVLAIGEQARLGNGCADGAARPGWLCALLYGHEAVAAQRTPEGAGQDGAWRRWETLASGHGEQSEPPLTLLLRSTGVKLPFLRHGAIFEFQSIKVPTFS